CRQHLPLDLVRRAGRLDHQQRERCRHRGEQDVLHGRHPEDQRRRPLVDAPGHTGGLHCRALPPPGVAPGSAAQIVDDAGYNRHVRPHRLRNHSTLLWHFAEPGGIILPQAPDGQTMEATESRAGGTTTLRISGRVDGSVSKQLEQRVQDIISRDEHVIVDLGAMSYVSSAGLRCFIILAKYAKAKQKSLALVALQDEVSEIFEISGLLNLFKVYGTVDDAVAALPR